MSAAAPLGIVLQSPFADRVHYALVLATAAAATNRPVTLFVTMGATRALEAGDGAWGSLPVSGEEIDGAAYDARLAARGVGTIGELIEALAPLGVRTIVCDAGLAAIGMAATDLRPDIGAEIAGVVTFLAACPAGTLTFYI